MGTVPSLFILITSYSAWAHDGPFHFLESCCSLFTALASVYTASFGSHNIVFSTFLLRNITIFPFKSVKHFNNPFSYPAHSSFPFLRPRDQGIIYLLILSALAFAFSSIHQSPSKLLFSCSQFS